MTDTLSTWDHIAASHDGVETVIYLNGQRVAVQGELLVPDYDDHPLLVSAGSDDEVISDFFNGGLEDLRVFNYANLGGHAHGAIGDRAKKTTSSGSSNFIHRKLGPMTDGAGFDLNGPQRAV